MTIKYITIITKYIFFILILINISFPANSDSSVEEIIKGRKALFSKNYSTAKKVQTFASQGDFEKAKSLMMEMSKNYKSLLEYFPENSMKGFKTEALPIIWENKVDYNLSESGVHPGTFNTLFKPDFIDQIANTELTYGFTEGSNELRESISSIYKGSTPDNIQAFNTFKSCQPILSFFYWFPRIFFTPD